MPVPAVAPRLWPRSAAVRVPAAAVVARPVVVAVLAQAAAVAPHLWPQSAAVRAPELVAAAVVPVQQAVAVVAPRCLRLLSSKAVAVEVRPVVVRPAVVLPVVGPQEPSRCRPRWQWLPRR
ncbi:hypothetical protein [Mycolicibacterium sp. J2]|uniref:hypothetical protein n=1 Tax=Mycolicibacterium sp. J2 TaxID=2993511 RepID=UPI00224AC0A6|nr:hypothetical protein [Mycolicibacterium sp. J2]MCX2714945.1 hypothetical protein [Mycolicibacterium sp. J2]